MRTRSTPSRSFAWLVLTAAVAIGSCGGGEAAAAALLHSGSAAGLDLTITSQWPEGPGYQPVQIAVAPSTGAPLPTDRTVTVEFLLRRRSYPGRYDLRVEQQIELPAGSRGVTETLSLVQLHDCRHLAINVYDDGVLRPALSKPWAYTASSSYSSDYWREALPVILLVGDQVADTTQLADPLPRGSDRYRGFPPQPPNPPQPPVPLPTAFACPPQRLPEKWIDYSALDVVCLSLAQLSQLRQSPADAARFRGLREWTASGGNLWVCGLGRSWQRMADLEDLLELTPGSADRQSPPEPRGWTAPHPKRYGDPIRGVRTSDYDPYVSPPQPYYDEAPPLDVQLRESEPVGESEPSPPPDLVPPEQPHFMFRRLELGMVVGFSESDPLPGTAADWAWVFNTLGPPRWQWYQRHGLSMTRPNPDFWSFLIPGVGLAPVGEFLVLITLFVLAIGPLNYLLLKRFKRLYLVVLTVPLSSATVTLLLVGYATVCDGLATRVRVRSFTELDQRCGHAACMARLSYYAGLAPRGGLSFPSDVAVQPLDQLPIQRRDRQPLSRDVVWDGDEQRLVSGWIRSRRPAQLVTVRSRLSDAALCLLSVDHAGGKCRVENRLGTRIHKLLVRPDDTQAVYWAEEIPLGAEVTLGQVEVAEARRRLRTSYRANEPAMPADVSRRYYTGIFGVTRNPFYVSGGYGSLLPPTQRTSLLEQSLIGLSAPAERGTPSLQPASYLAIVETAPEVVLGTASAREEGSYHVIRGKW